MILMPSKILIVDDKPANLVAMKHLLGQVDADIVTAESGNEALALTLDSDFALILLDVNMPGMDGYEVAEHLRGDENTRKIPLIFVTAAYRDDVHKRKAYGSGAVDYIEKPIDESILLAKVGIFLELYETNQELLHAREQAEKASKSKTEFLARMSHELRTPLNAVMGFSQFLDSSNDSPLNEMQQEYIDGILKSATHLLGLIDKILHFADIESGTLAHPQEALCIRTMVDAALESVEHLAAENDNFINLVTPDDLGKMMVYPDGLVDILSALLENACRFTKQGQVTLNINRETDVCGDVMVFIITDTGIGMPPEFRDLLFEAFAQVEPSTSSTFGGLGLGLATSHELCRIMGGTIIVKSSLGEGSTFTLRLPASPQQNLRAENA